MSKTPWWFGWALLAIVVLMPSTVVWAAHSIVNALDTISQELAPSTSVPGEQP